jgi:PDDEXK-like domain of unknown function (DUF3799)
MSIERNVSIESYHENARISHSMLKDFSDRGPCYFYRRYIEKSIPRKTSEAFSFGQAFETLVQRPLEFNKEVIVAPEGLDGRTKQGKEFKASCAGREFISHFEFRQMERMLEAYREHTLAVSMVNACEQQVTLTHENLQARPDWVCLEGSAETSFLPISIDLKTCDDINELRNARKLIRFSYHTQAAFVRRMLALNGFPNAQCYLLCVEKETPHRVAMFRLREDLLDVADRWIDVQLGRLWHCMDTNTWPRVEPGIVEIGKPGWLQEEEAA